MFDIEETLNKLPSNPVSDNDENNYSEGVVINNLIELYKNVINSGIILNMTLLIL